jgi:stage III sporulation protein AB
MDSGKDMLMNFKWVGAILILCGCGGCGFSLAAMEIREERGLRRLITALDFMGCELQYRLTPLPELCRITGREAAGCIGVVFSKLAGELEAQATPDVYCCMAVALSESPGLPNSVRQAFTELGQTLGRFDLDGQLKGLECVRNACRIRLAELGNNKAERLRSYQTLGLCAGAALAILLL